VTADAVAFLVNYFKKGEFCMLWGPNTDAARAVVDEALTHVRDTQHFDWTFIALLALVVIGVYVPRIREKKWDAIGAALGLYGIHWLCEIVNAIICHITGYGLWNVTQESTSFILLIGVSWELSMMFSIAGFSIELMPEDRKAKLFGINNRILYVLSMSLGFSVFEIFLANTNAFQWVYPWWGALPVWITVYIPFFIAAVLGFDLQGKAKKIYLGSIWALVAVCLAVLCPLGII